MLGGNMLLCHIGPHRIAFRLADVTRVLPLPRLARPPGLPAPLAGFARIGREAVAVVRLDRLFGTGADEAVDLYAHLVQLASSDPPMALLIDRAEGVVEITADAIRPVPAADSLGGAVEAEFDQGGTVVHLLASGRLLLAEERARLAALTAEAARRREGWLLPA